MSMIQVATTHDKKVVRRPMKSVTRAQMMVTAMPTRLSLLASSLELVSLGRMMYPACGERGGTDAHARRRENMKGSAKLAMDAK